MLTLSVVRLCTLTSEVRKMDQHQSNSQNAQPSLKFVIGVVIACIGAVVQLVINNFLRDWIIIGFGVRIFNTVKNLGVIIAIIGCIVTIVFAIPIFRYCFQQRRQQKTQTKYLTELGNDNGDPRVALARLIQLVQNIPGSRQIAERCRQQMEQMDNIQERQHLLLTTNDAIYLNDTVEVLDRVERYICQNCIKVVNLCIAAGTPERFNQAAIDQLLADNAAQLKNANQLLQVSAVWINQYDAKQESRGDLERWIATIQQSLKED